MISILNADPDFVDNDREIVFLRQRIKDIATAVQDCMNNHQQTSLSDYHDDFIRLINLCTDKP